jgi:hypothetical protein
VILQEKIMQYKELSDEAKEHAFKRHVEYAQSNDYYWWESTQEYWAEKLEGLGIYTATDSMHFSGFGNQGDGACFTGSINLREFLEAHPDLKKEHVKLYMATIPFDHRGAACEYFDIELTRQSTQYSHHNTVHLGSWDLNTLPEYDTEDGEDYERLIIDAEADIEWQCREYMKEIYRDLEKEYEYMQSMECFLEGVDYKDFDEEGELT